MYWSVCVCVCLHMKQGFKNVSLGNVLVTFTSAPFALLLDHLYLTTTPFSLPATVGT